MQSVADLIKSFHEFYEECEMKVLFEKFDQSIKGKISIVELGNGFHKLEFKFDPKVLPFVMELFDIDEDGFLNYEEFTTMITQGSSFF